MSVVAASKATSLDLFSLRSIPMRTFHLAWAAFFVCFFAWFAVAPLMPVIKAEFGLTKDQVANINIAAVAVTILVRMLVGPMCDRYGPRKVYTGLLALGAIPVIGIAFAHSYEVFLACRLAIGAIGASFVITQYHTSVMFAPNVVGVANAASAGWGNAGGGVTQALMPLILVAVLAFGVSPENGWRWAMLVPGALMLLMAFAYWRFAVDTPAGNLDDLRAQGAAVESGKKGGWDSFKLAASNYRVWMLFVTYGACFGVEIFIHNIAASYYVDRFGLSLKAAGLAAGSFGLLALFARALGGLLSDRVASKKGLDGRTLLLFGLIVGEGLGLAWFSQMQSVAWAVVAMLSFGLFTHMACGATYALVPFIDRKALGGVSGIIGAGGNVGAVAAGFLMKGVGDVSVTLGILGGFVLTSALCALAVRFTAAHKSDERAAFAAALAHRQALTESAGTMPSELAYRTA